MMAQLDFKPEYENQIKQLGCREGAEGNKRPSCLSFREHEL